MSWRASTVLVSASMLSRRRFWSAAISAISLSTAATRALGLVRERVDFLLAVVVARGERAVLYADEEGGRVGLVLVLAHGDERAEVEREGDEALLRRLQPLQKGLARIRVAVNDGDRA